MAPLQHVYCPFKKNIRAFRNFSTSVNFHLDLSKGPTSLVEIPMRSQKANWNKIIQNQLLFSFPKHTDFHGFHQHFNLGRLGDSLDWLLYESGRKSQLWLHVFHQRLVLGKSNMSSSPKQHLYLKYSILVRVSIYPMKIFQSSSKQHRDFENSIFVFIWKISHSPRWFLPVLPSIFGKKGVVPPRWCA